MTALILSNIATVVAFLAVVYKLEKTHKEERQELYQRIQAPMVAVAQHATPAAGNPLKHSIEPDDDDAYREYLEEVEAING